MTVSILDTITLNSDEYGVNAGAMDNDGTYAYFATEANANRIVKVAVNPFARTSSIDIVGGPQVEENQMAVSQNNVMIYGESVSNVLRVITIAHPIFGYIATITPYGRSGLAIDNVNNRFYMTGPDDTTRVFYKNILSTVTPSASINIVVGVTAKMLGAVADPTNGFVYFADNRSGGGGGRIYKIRISDWVHVDTLAPGINALTSLLLDVNEGFLYAVGGSLIKISLASFTIINSLVLTTGRAAVISPLARRIYIFSADATMRLEEIDLDAFSILSTTNLTAGAGGVPALALHTTTGILLVGTNAAPAKIIKLQVTVPPPARLPVAGGPNMKRRPYPFDVNTVMSRL